VQFAHARASFACASRSGSTLSVGQRRSLDVRWRVCVLAVLLAVAASAVSTSAFASPSARLVYARAPEAAACPDESMLRKAVAARFGYDPFFPWAKQTVVVQVWRDHRRHRARVQLVGESGVAQGVRELTSDQETCSELFDAIALAISIALDMSDPPAAAPAPAPPALAEPEAPPAAETPPWPPPAREGDDVASQRPLRTPRVRWTVGVDGVIDVDTSPSVAPGLAVSIRGRVGAFSMGLEALGDVSVPSTLGEGRVESSVAAGALVPCGHVGMAFLCAVGELGQWTAWGLDVIGSQTRGTLFAEAGGRVGLEWPLSETLALRLRGDALVNLHRSGLELVGISWAAQTVSYDAGLGVAISFR
jgi:hypothetical protein